MNDRQSDALRQIVRENYARVAKQTPNKEITTEDITAGEPMADSSAKNQSGACCAPSPGGTETKSSACCGPSSADSPPGGTGTGGCGGATGAESRSLEMGYSGEELGSVPEGANMGLGCGNPQAIAALQPGETVLDLGSGGGFDCFLAAARVGGEGRVIGVDMTPEMISKARDNARKGGFSNVSFRLGEIEHLPVPDGSVDAILSNCVINLSPDKPQVYRDAFRVLKPGGRLAINDVAVTAPLPRELREDERLLSGCVAGAAAPEEIEDILRDAGFEAIRVRPKDESRELIREWAPGLRLEEYIVSVIVEAVKPAA